MVFFLWILAAVSSPVTVILASAYIIYELNAIGIVGPGNFAKIKNILNSYLKFHL